MYCLCSIFYWHAHTHYISYIYIYTSISNTYWYEMLIDSIDHTYLGQQREQRCRRTLLAPLLVHPQQKYRKKMRHMRQGHPMTTQFDSILYRSVICVCRKLEHHLNLMVYHNFSNSFPTKWPFFFFFILTHFLGISHIQTHIAGAMQHRQLLSTARSGEQRGRGKGRLGELHAANRLLAAADSKLLYYCNANRIYQ